MAYDQTDPKSIEEYAAKLVGKSLADFGVTEEMVNIKDKGHFGTVLEREFLKINPGNKPGVPDIPEAGVEVKTTSLKRLKDGTLTGKERLKLSSLNFDEIKHDQWENGLVKRKNSLILLIAKEADANPAIRQIVRLVKLWSFPPEDEPILRNDWETIKRLVIDGREEDISGGVTDYLEASTAGEGGQGGDPLKKRAIALKSGYISAVLRELLYGQKYTRDSVLAKARNLNKALSLEAFVLSKLKPFLGKDVDDIASDLDVTASKKSKNYFAMLTRKAVNVMLSLRPERHDQRESGFTGIEEFDKAEIMLKTVRLQKNGFPKESLVLRPPFQYTEILKETWEESELRNKLTKRILFVVFKETAGGKFHLYKAFFWKMPESILDTHIKSCWDKTVARIRDGRWTALPTMKESRYCHVRPQASNKKDTYPTPDGGNETKKGFWLNNKYVGEIIARAPELGESKNYQN